MKNLTFIDLFSGCGGLSLGLLNSGWRGIFAVEKSADAFLTLKHNLVNRSRHNKHRPKFDWPEWLAVEPFEIRQFIKQNRKQLLSLKGKVNLVAGGPPCQGFSFAGKRNSKDTRNQLFRHHIEMVDILKPEVVLMENVRGIDTGFNAKSGKSRGRPVKSYASKIKDSLKECGYEVQQKVVRAMDFGVPQFRPRYFTIGIRTSLYRSMNNVDIFKMLLAKRTLFLKKKGLPVDRAVTVAEAVSDLVTAGKTVVACTESESFNGFMEVGYGAPASSYQLLMRNGLNGQSPNSHRLVNHRVQTVRRFKGILANCRKGVQLSEQKRRLLKIKKNAITPLDGDQPSHTLTTLPDDLLHYSEPRIHTVREHARFQSFPDWFEFLGNYTTGGDRRARECPRYTQVGNAVPPLLAEAIGEILADIIKGKVG